MIFMPEPFSTLTLTLSPRRGDKTSSSLLLREKGIAQRAFKKGGEGDSYLHSATP